jgi:hypothetical protein
LTVPEAQRRQDRIERGRNSVEHRVVRRHWIWSERHDFIFADRSGQIVVEFAINVPGRRGSSCQRLD